MSSRFVKLAVGFVAATSALTACNSSSSGSSTSSTASPGSQLSTIASLADMQKQLAGKGIACKLEYEGLKQDDKTLSICTIDGQQATLSIWDSPDKVQKFLKADVGAKGATAVGANWTIDVDKPETAQKIATALSGTVKSQSSSSTGSTSPSR